MFLNGLRRQGCSKFKTVKNPRLIRQPFGETEGHFTIHLQLTSLLFPRKEIEYHNCMQELVQPELGNNFHSFLSSPMHNLKTTVFVYTLLHEVFFFHIRVFRN